MLRKVNKSLRHYLLLSLYLSLSVFLVIRKHLMEQGILVVREQISDRMPWKETTIKGILANIAGRFQSAWDVQDDIAYLGILCIVGLLAIVCMFARLTKLTFLLLEIGIVYLVSTAFYTTGYEKYVYYALLVLCLLSLLFSQKETDKATQKGLIKSDNRDKPKQTKKPKKQKAEKQSKSEKQKKPVTQRKPEKQRKSGNRRKPIKQKKAETLYPAVLRMGKREGKYYIHQTGFIKEETDEQQDKGKKKQERQQRKLMKAAERKSKMQTRIQARYEKQFDRKKRKESIPAKEPRPSEGIQYSFREEVLVNEFERQTKQLLSEEVHREFIENPEEQIPEEQILNEQIPEEQILEEQIPEEQIPEEQKPEEHIPKLNFPEEDIKEENIPEENTPKEYKIKDLLSYQPAPEAEEKLKEIQVKVLKVSDKEQ